jgi:hypothetical protein
MNADGSNRNNLSDKRHSNDTTTTFSPIGGLLRWEMGTKMALYELTLSP